MALDLVADFEKRFPRGPSIECALRITGEGTLVLFGPSASGKTTILRCLAGLERPESGTIRFGEETWFEAERGILVPPQSRGVGLLFQSQALFPHLTVRGNVAYGAVDPARTAEALGLLGLEHLRDRFPARLSGGEKQRTALARVLATRPRLLLLDEPLSALDAPAREELQRDLRKLLRATPARSVVVTHDRLEALVLGDLMAVIVGGTIRQVGPVPDVFSRPSDLEVARIVGVETVVPARVTGRDGEGLLLVEAGRAQLLAVDPGGLAEAVFACIRAEDVVLERGEGGRLSARNRLRGPITSLHPEGPLVRVSLDCGFPLSALVTRPSQSELGLGIGVEVTAFVKSPSVHLIPR
jgi:molybdate transport system ATP-binding protein